MILSVHQPYFLPWLGLFDKIEQSDRFVIFDSTQYPRGRSIANRNQFRVGNQAKELVASVSIPKGKQGLVQIREVNFASETKWRKRLLRTLEVNYASAPYREKYLAEIEAKLHLRNLCEFNVCMLLFFLKELNIKTPVRLLSDLEKANQIPRDRDGRIIELCRQLHCDKYLSGSKGKEYNDESRYSESNIELLYQDFRHPVYPQQNVPFLSHLSVVDLLMNCGPASRDHLFPKHRRRRPLQ